MSYTAEFKGAAIARVRELEAAGGSQGARGRAGFVRPVAREFGVPATTLQSWVNERPAKSRHASPEERRRGASMVLDEGMTTREVSEALGATLHTVQSWVRSERARRSEASGD